MIYLLCQFKFCCFPNSQHIVWENGKSHNKVFTTFEKAFILYSNLRHTIPNYSVAKLCF